MAPESCLTYAQLHADRTARVAQRNTATEPFESLLIFLEGEGFRNENTGIRMEELMSRPEDELILIPFRGEEYHVVRVSYPTNQQFSRFTIVRRAGSQDS